MEPTPDSPYTEHEILSYLPTGWRLAAADAPMSWEPKKRRWRARVYDSADQSWEVSVGDADAASGGRLAALQREFDRIYREALG